MRRTYLGIEKRHPVQCWTVPLWVAFTVLLAWIQPAGWASIAVASVQKLPNGGWGAVWRPGSGPGQTGGQLAFLSSQGTEPAELQLWDPAREEFHQLSHGGADQPVWSPDGKSISYRSSRRGRSERWRVQIQDGTTLLEPPLHFVPVAAAHLLSPDGETLAFVSTDEEGTDLHLVAPGDEQPRRVTAGFTVRDFTWSPQGDKIALTATNPLSHRLPQVWVYDLAASRLAHFGSSGSLDPVWSADGKLLAYALSYPGRGYRVVVAAPGGASGQPVENLIYQGDGMAWSPVSNLLAVVVQEDAASQLWLVDSQGAVTTRLSHPGVRIRFPAWSADGRYLAVEAMRPEVSAVSEVWTVEVARGEWRNLTPSRTTCWGLSLAKHELLFLANKNGVVRAWRQRIAGSALDQPAAPAVAIPGSEGALSVAACPSMDQYAIAKGGTVTVTSGDGATTGTWSPPGVAPRQLQWSPVGTHLTVEGRTKEKGKEEAIWVLVAGESGKIAETASFAGRDPAWRPDSAALAFARNEQLWQISPDGGNPIPLVTVAANAEENVRVFDPTWAPTGEAVAFAVIRSSPEQCRQELYVWQPNECKLVFSQPVTTEFAAAPWSYTSPPAWLADDRLLFTSDHGGSPQLWAVRADGSGLRALTSQVSLWPVSDTNTRRVYYARPDDPSPLWSAADDGSNPSPLPWTQ